jgi:hypothetical protein
MHTSLSNPSSSSGGFWNQTNVRAAGVIPTWIVYNSWSTLESIRHHDDIDKFIIPVHNEIMKSSIGLFCKEKFSGAIFQIAGENFKLGGERRLSREGREERILFRGRGPCWAVILRRLTRPSIYLDTVLVYTNSVSHIHSSCDCEFIPVNDILAYVLVSKKGLCRYAYYTML